MDASDLKNITIRSPDEVVRGLVANYQRAELDRQPLIEITVSNGMQVWTGLPVQLADIRGATWFALMSARGQNAPDISYLPLSRIECLTVHGLGTEQIDFFKTGTVKARPLDVPGRLEMKKMAEAMAQGFVDKGWKSASIELDWNSLSSDEDAVAAVFRTLRTFPATIEKLLADEFGKEALAAVRAAVFCASAGKELTTAFAKGRLEITVGKDLQDPRLSETLYQKVQAVL